MSQMLNGSPPCPYNTSLFFTHYIKISFVSCRIMFSTIFFPNFIGSTLFIMVHWTKPRWHGLFNLLKSFKDEIVFLLVLNYVVVLSLFNYVVVIGNIQKSRGKL
jgi:hypothetical protein